MHRTEGTNHIGNLFTDGPPGTVVEEKFLNAVQEEMANVIEMAGLTLKTAATDTRDQLFNAFLQGVLTAPGAIDVVIASEVLPTGWLECDGASILRASYASLFSGYERSIGTAFGTVDGDHFTLPDLRGQFLRGWDHGAGTDPDAGTRTDRGDGITGDHIGTKQTDEFESHVHTFSLLEDVGASLTPQDGGGVTAGQFTSDATGGNETRPVNTNVMFIIKT